MRLTCPNCGAQYEVPDEVIPSDGRDVQCSNCGDTWFQSHDDSPAPADPAPEQHSDQHVVEEEEEETPSQEEQTAPDPAPIQTQMDTSVKDILREEAAHEAQIRAAESSNRIESQPDLGLDDIAEESDRRADEAKSRMARIRGTGTGSETPAKADPVSGSSSRRGLLPDIEEINSTLRADGDKPDPNTAVGPVSVKSRRKSGFTRGFAVAILIAVGLAMVYVKAPQIAQSFPQVDPALNAYVARVDKTRQWLDAKIGDLIPNTDE